MNDIDVMLELIDTGDGVPLTNCEQNLYEALANMEDMWEARDKEENEIRRATIKRLENALGDMSELVADVKRLRDFIQSVWDRLGEAGRNEHYELFKDYMGDD